MRDKTLPFTLSTMKMLEAARKFKVATIKAASGSQHTTIKEAFHQTTSCRSMGNAGGLAMDL